MSKWRYLPKKSEIVRFSYKYRFWFLIAGTLLICLLINVKASAAEELGILDITERGMKATEAWWDNLWVDTFDPPGEDNGNISIYSFANPVRFLLATGTIFWMVDYGKKMSQSQGMVNTLTISFDSSWRILLIVLFLTDQGVYSRFLAYGLRDITYSWSEGLMQQKIVEVRIKDAIEGQLLIEEVKNQIRRQGEKCMQLPRPAVILPSADRPSVDPGNRLTIEQDQAYRYLECLDKLRVFIEDKREEALSIRQCGLACRLFKAWMKTLFTDLDRGIIEERRLRIPGYRNIDDNKAEETYYSIYSMVDFMQHFERKGWTGTFAITQWIWITFLEGAMWLSGLFAPLFIASALIPSKEKMFEIWLIDILTIGLARLAYVALIGVVAVQISTADPALKGETGETPAYSASNKEVFLLSNDDRFLMAMGVFAPAVSLTVVGAGALAAASSYRSQSVSAVAAVSGIATGSIASVAYTLSRHADKRR